MDDSKPRRFDLAKALEPLEVETPHLGKIALDVRTTDFLSWMEKRAGTERWADPHHFLRDLLEQRGVATKDRPAPQPDAIAALEGVALEEIAGMVADKAAASFLPRQVIDEASGHPRPRRDGDPDPSQALPGEAHSVRLRRIMLGYLEYHRNQTRRLLATVRKASAATEFLRKPDALSSVLRAQSLASSFLASDVYRRSVLDVERVSALATVRALASSSLFEQHRRLAVEMGILGSPLAGLQETIRGMIGVQASHRLAERDRLFGDSARWAKVADAQLRLGLSASVIASLAATPATEIAALSIAAQAAAILRPGYQTAATLALEGLAARGAVAELLRRYETGAINAPVFESVRETLVSLDDEAMTGVRFMELFEQAWAAIVRMVGDTPDLIRNPAFLAWLAILISLAGTTFTAYQIWGPPPAEIVSRLDAGNSELREMNRKLDADRRKDEAERFIRYVHQVVNLRAEPHRGGQLLRLIYPDQPVRIIEAKGEWARVEVFDYGSDAPVRGWISRRYLRAAPPAS